jgi:hypothetical protein
VTFPNLDYYTHFAFKSQHRYPHAYPPLCPSPFPAASLCLGTEVVQGMPTRNEAPIIDRSLRGLATKLRQYRKTFRPYLDLMSKTGQGRKVPVCDGKSICYVRKAVSERPKISLRC